MRRTLFIILLGLVLSACTIEIDFDDSSSPANTNNPPATTSTRPAGGEEAIVTRVIDGDTIDVRIHGEIKRVRYVGMNTPEREEACYQEARDANANLVEGQTVYLVKDISDTDQYDRLLRYIYVGDLFVNERLVQQGHAEVVSYPPDTAYFEHFRDLEQAAAEAGRGCHPTGIFDDGTYRR